MGERHGCHLELSSAVIGVSGALAPSPRSQVVQSQVLLRAAPNILLPELLLGMFLFLFKPSPAQAARCPDRTQFYRPSLGVCEAKAGNPLYRARSAGKTSSAKVKSARIFVRAARPRP